MRHLTRAAIAATFLVAGTAAGAHASADVSFAGLDLSVDGSGTRFNAFFFGQPIAAGTSLTQTFQYAITLHADGLPAERSWDVCLPLPGSDCGPAPTGSEQVEFEFGFQNTKEASPFTSYQFTGLTLQQPLVDTSGTVTYDGSFSITETVAPMGTYENLDYLAGWGMTWVDSNDAQAPVPEPGSCLLMLLGLGVVGSRRVRAEWSTRQT